MNIYITLDYELFFGNKSGSVKNCLIKPTNAILHILKKYNIKSTFFIDVGFLIKLHQFKNKYSKLEIDYNLIVLQIKNLIKFGHSVELHVHPHWEGSYYNGDSWVFNIKQYKISDFTEFEIDKIITNYKVFLEKITHQKINVYRAGGWCIQPFHKIKNALLKNKIFIDSTVFSGGFYNSKFQDFDFRKTPKNKSFWRFENKPTLEDLKGRFVEIPISSIKVSPIYFWKFTFFKIFKLKKHISYGDGVSIKPKFSHVLNLLTKPSYTVVSIDGYKSNLLIKAIKLAKKSNEKKSNFVIIGHPKAFTTYSLKNLDLFISKNINIHNFTTYNESV